MAEKKKKNDPFFGAKTKEVTLPSGQKVQAIDIGSAKPPAATKVGMVSPISGLTITGTERSPAKEVEAMQIGYTKEYIASRGGINAMGYFNDTPASGQLNAEEYKSVTKTDGTVNTAAMAQILQEKKRQELSASGISASEIESRLASEWSTLYSPSKSAGYNSVGQPEQGGQYNASGEYVGTMGGTGAPVASGTIGGVTNPSGKTLAQDAFINTFKLIVGESEGSKGYVAELYKYISGFWKSGSTIEEAINLSLRAAKNDKAIPEFTNRFAAIFSLEEMKKQGKVVDVPTIAEYVKSEQALGEVLNRAGLGDLATEATLANVFSTGKSVAETTSIINDVFLAIDNAPAAWKANVAKVIPFADRNTLAKAILLGDEGATSLRKTVAKAGVLTAAERQGLTLTSAQQSELVASGESFGTSLGKFAQTRGVLDTAQKLKSIEMGIAPQDAYTQEQAMAATFNQSYDELQNLANLSEREQARFKASAGIIGSKGLASQQRGLI
jgi:hypothetical protein